MIDKKHGKVCKTKEFYTALPKAKISECCKKSHFDGRNRVAENGANSLVFDPDLVEADLKKNNTK